MLYNPRGGATYTSSTEEISEIPHHLDDYIRQGYFFSFTYTLALKFIAFWPISSQNITAARLWGEEIELVMSR